jgi:hypothetical protein
METANCSMYDGAHGGVFSFRDLVEHDMALYR